MIHERDIAEWLGRQRAGWLRPDIHVEVTKPWDQDVWVVRRLLTNERVLISGLEVLQHANSVDMQTIYEQVKAEHEAKERGYQVFPGWREANRLRDIPDLPRLRVKKRPMPPPGDGL